MTGTTGGTSREMGHERGSSVATSTCKHIVLSNAVPVKMRAPHGMWRCAKPRLMGFSTASPAFWRSRIIPPVPAISTGFGLCLKNKGDLALLADQSALFGMQHL
jgi:hypothetical protein